MNAILDHLVGDHGRISCPHCSSERKKSNLKDCVVTRGDKGWVYHCHHCDTSGLIPFTKTYKPESNVIPMIKPIAIDAMQDRHYEFLKSRGISQEVADAEGIFAAEKWFNRLEKKTDAVAFPYYKNGKLIAAKYRSIESKDFMQDAGGAKDFFRIDSIDPAQPIIIVEGEIDALTCIQAGLTNVISVPSGAPMKVTDGKVDASEDKKFAFVWSANDILKKAPHIVISTDTDSAGQALAEELARRIGKERCRIAKFDYKDLNEAFLDKGADEVKRIINDAEPYPINGLSKASKFFDRLNDMWEKGIGSGTSTGYSNVDQIYTIAEGQLTIVTGYPSSGKSNFIDQVVVNLARKHDWKFAMCSFENHPPERHIQKLLEIYTEKSFFESVRRMSREEREKAEVWVDNHFIFLNSEGVEPSTIDSIIERSIAAVAQMGIRGLVIDPYNYVENKSGTSETEFISGMLTRVQAFAKAYGVHVWFVAHPSKITRSGMEQPRPDGMAISGSMAWWAKADCGLTVHRNPSNEVEIWIWKCRDRWVGKQGETKLGYDIISGTYHEFYDAF